MLITPQGRIFGIHQKLVGRMEDVSLALYDSMYVIYHISSLDRSWNNAYKPALGKVVEMFPNSADSGKDTLWGYRPPCHQIICMQKETQ